MDPTIDTHQDSMRQNRQSVKQSASKLVPAHRRHHGQHKKHDGGNAETYRTSGPDVFDLRLNSHSRLNLIQALIQAINLGADEALMLDPRGFVASCNSTNFFIVRGDDELWTSTGLYSFKGITQANVIRAWQAAGGLARECDFTLAQVYSAKDAFVTGTLGGVTPVTKIDGRLIGDGKPGKATGRAGELYQRFCVQAG